MADAAANLSLSWYLMVQALDGQVVVPEPPRPGPMRRHVADLTTPPAWESIDSLPGRERRRAKRAPAVETSTRNQRRPARGKTTRRAAA